MVIGDISELYGEEFRFWRDEVDEYRWTHSIEETARFHDIPEHVVEQFDALQEIAA